MEGNQVFIVDMSLAVALVHCQCLGTDFDVLGFLWYDSTGDSIVFKAFDKGFVLDIQGTLPFAVEYAQPLDESLSFQFSSGAIFSMHGEEIFLYCFSTSVEYSSFCQNVSVSDQVQAWALGHRCFRSLDLPVHVKLDSLAILKIRDQFDARSSSSILKLVCEFQDKFCPFTSYNSQTRSSRTLVIVLDPLSAWATNFLSCDSDNRFHTFVSCAVGVSTAVVSESKLKMIESSKGFRDVFSQHRSSLFYLDLTCAVLLGFIRQRKTEFVFSWDTYSGQLVEQVLFDLMHDGLTPMIVLRILDSEISPTRSFPLLSKECKHRLKTKISCGDTIICFSGIRERRQEISRFDIASGKQFAYLMDASEMLFLSLEQVLMIKLKPIPDWNLKLSLKKRALSLVDHLLRKRSDDFLIYDELYKFYSHEVEYKNSEEAATSSGRASARISEILALFCEGVTFRNVLDVGCSEGNITESLGQALSLSVDNTFGCDVRDLKHQGKFMFSRISDDNVLPYESNKFELVVSLMVLHHVENLSMLLQEIFRVIVPGGLFVIREHDCDSEGHSVLLDVLHGMYALVYNSPREMTTENFASCYYARYQPKDYWIRTLQDMGFEHIVPTEAARFSLQGDAYIKSNRFGERFVSNPFRFFYAVFRKPLAVLSTN
jgi:SAM-dependent methyltransferase